MLFLSRPQQHCQGYYFFPVIEFFYWMLCLGTKWRMAGTSEKVWKVRESNPGHEETLFSFSQHSLDSVLLFLKMAQQGLIFSYYLPPWPGFEPTPAELHQSGTFWRMLYQLSYRAPIMSQLCQQPTTSMALITPGLFVLHAPIFLILYS